MNEETDLDSIPCPKSQLVFQIQIFILFQSWLHLKNNLWPFKISKWLVLTPDPRNGSSGNRARASVLVKSYLGKSTELELGTTGVPHWVALRNGLLTSTELQHSS